ncbi:hypothetical protein Tco_0141818 [Tanacetum coccineum]
MKLKATSLKLRDDNDAPQGLIRVFFIIIPDGERGHGSTSLTHLSLGRQRSRDYIHHQLAESRNMLLGHLSTGMDVHQSKGQGNLPDGRCITIMVNRNGKLLNAWL